jgi:phosphatidylglycerol:prolipoprotein diacylglycerol transferase
VSAWRIEWTLSPFLMGGLRWFTVFWLLELVFGFWLLARQVRRAGGDDSEAADLAVHVWIGLVIGARLGEAVFYQSQRLLVDPSWIFRFATNGGMSSHGAVVGTGLAVWLFAKRRSMAFLEITDRLAPSFAVAAIVHRIANLFNSEIVGKPSDGGWGVRFPFYDHSDNGPFRHPSQLYEAALGVLMLCCVWLADRLWGREERPRGAVTGIALSTYFAGRCIVELAKDAQPGEMIADPFNLGQLLSLPLLAAGLFLTWRSLRARAKAGWRA